MGRKCYVCGKTPDKDLNVTLHSFPQPSNECIYKKWIDVLALYEGDETKSLKVCSWHFLPTDYAKEKFGGKLKPSAVPSVGVPKKLPVPTEEPVFVEPTFAESDNVADQVMISRNIGPERSPAKDADRSIWDTPENSPDKDDQPMEVSPAKSGNSSPSDEDILCTAGIGIGSPPAAVLADRTNTMSAGNTPVKASENTPVHERRRFAKPRYVAEISTSDVATPRRAESTIKFVKEKHGAQSVKVKRLQKDVRKATQRIAALEDEVVNLRMRLDANSPKIVQQQDAAAPVDNLSLEALGKDLKNSVLLKYWNSSYLEGRLILLYLGDYVDDPEAPLIVSRAINIKPDMTVEIRAKGKICQVLDVGKITCKEDIYAAMEAVTALHLCKGGGENGSCRGDGLFKEKVRLGQCPACMREKRKSTDTDRKRVQRVNLKKSLLIKRRKNLQRKLYRLQTKLDQTLDNVEELRKQCSQTEEAAFESALRNFPKQQQEALRACLHASKCKGPTGRRYSNAWVLECLLLRIKSRKAYLHIRNHNILPLPTLATLSSYMEKLEPSFGFNVETFDLLRAKAQHMEPHARRGTLVIDEMKISEALAFDSKNLLFKGFTDLGEHTPEHQKNVRGDHALVFLFQPFHGKWVQTVGAFLSKGCASSTALHHLILECVVLLENAGFFVDVVTTDGATWNRSMWKLFGLSGSDNSCEHPCAVDGCGRRLFFCSDFSHLVKNFRNFLTGNSETWTPSGVIKMSHFQAVLKCDESIGRFGLRIAHKLTKDHLAPTSLQKMKVGMALQLFEDSVSAAMTMYQSTCPELQDCGPTVEFLRMFNKVIVAMTARHYAAALSVGSDSAKVIADFIAYLEDWKFQASELDYKFMTDSTYHGFIVTLKTALDLCTFLKEKCGYDYLLTARLTQDALEAFFGMLRSACGSTDHPTSLLFIQVYRLLSLYSLVKPPKGSNVEGAELFEMLLNSEEAKESIENRDEWEEIQDNFVLKGPESGEIHRPGDEHDYDVSKINECVQAYFSGFVARRMRQWTKCTSCLATLTKEVGDKPQDALINILSQGHLLYPSDALLGLLCACERAILKTIGTEEIGVFTFLHIADNILAESAPFVGCTEHRDSLTKTAINYYTVTRARILVKTYNKNFDDKRKAEKANRKKSKL